MLGAIAGDVIGSRFERHPVKSTTFDLFHEDCRYTDDSVLTCAIAEALLSATGYADALRHWCMSYPDAGYGARFWAWVQAGDAGPYQSWGNGSAMRVSPVGWLQDSVESVLEQARLSAVVTHDHPEAIAGAQAVALGIFLLRNGVGPDRVKGELEMRFGYDLSTPLAVIRPEYSFEMSCSKSVPQAIRAFLEADDFETAVRNAISLGGDADTQAAIAGSLAEARWGVPNELRHFVLARLPVKMRQVLQQFERAVTTLAAE